MSSVKIWSTALLGFKEEGGEIHVVVILRMSDTSEEDALGGCLLELRKNRPNYTAGKHVTSIAEVTQNGLAGEGV